MNRASDKGFNPLNQLTPNYTSKPNSNGERSFQEKEDLLDVVTKAAKLGIHKYDLISGKIEWDHKIRQIWGIDYAELVNYETFISHIHPEDQQKTEEEIKKALDPNGKGEYYAEYRVINRINKAIIWVAATGQTFFENGSPVRLIGTVQDITKRKEAEAALRQSESRYRNLHESLQDAFVQVNITGQIIEHNGLFCKMLGYTSNELSKLTYQDLTPERWHAYEEDIVQNQILKRGYSDIYEKEYRRKDGSIIPVELRATLAYDKFGNPCSMWAIVRDITERKTHEKALIQSEEQYRKLVEISPYAIIISRLNKFTYFNPAALKLFDASSPEQLLGKTTLDLFHSAAQTHVEEKLKGALEGYNFSVFEVKILQLNGSTRDVEITGTSFFDSQGIAIQVILKDITEDKILKSNMARFQLLTQYARDPLILVNLKGDIIEANISATEFYGYTREELLKLQIYDLRNDNVDLINNQIKTASKSGILFETIHLKRNGTSVPVEVSSRNVMVDGENMLLSVVRDISERKKAELLLRDSEEKYRLLFTKMTNGFSLHEIILGKDQKPKNSKIIAVNPHFELLTGFKSETVIGKSLLDLFPEMEQLRISIYENIALTGQSMESELYSPRLSKYLKLNVFCPQEGFFAIVYEDTTTHKLFEIERIIAEEKLQKNAQELEELNRVKDKFFRIIAHDLKNPFTVLIGASDMLCQNIENRDFDTVVKLGKMVNSVAKNGHELLENLLEWSKSQTGNINFHPQKFNIKKELDLQLTNMATYAASKKIKLVLNVPENLEIRADNHMFNTILRNLIENAIKFTNENGEVCVEAKQKKNNVILCIKDNGIGIAPENIEKLFRLDFKYSRLGTAKEKGTGLGLILCKEFVDRHGGKIWVESTIEKGTEFNFSIPQFP